ncbi:MAG TPA: response regulator [Candidatus Angelobacter sp.]|nr:response regulator [Candidatus Angelobacter sp.]
MSDLNPQTPPVILLVEDNTLDVKLLMAALVRTPGEINLIRVNDGDKAVDYLTGTPPFDDREKYPIPITMMLDIKLPKRSGFEVLEWLRSQPGPIRRLPTVVFTSSQHKVDINKAFDRGANAYLTKPASVKELTSLLGDLKNFWLKKVELPDVVR